MKRIVGLMGSVALLLNACSFASRGLPDNRYYTLTVPGKPTGRLAGRVKLGAFSIDEAYKTARMAYRSSPYRLDYYSYHRWAADPRSLLAAASRDYLEQAESEGPPIEVRAHIRKIEELDDSGGWQGVLAVDLELRGQGIVVEKSYAESEPARERSPEAVAEAISRALGKILDQAVADAGRPPTAAPPAAP